MQNQLEKSAGIALIIGSILVIITMVFHPVGGNFEHLLKISKMAITSHALAILSIPILTFGFWGLTVRLGKNNSLSLLGFIIIVFGLLAGMMAAAINGLALSFFIKRYHGQSTEIIAQINHIIHYGFALNKAMDYIFIAACCFAIVLWSIVIVKKSILPKWIAYLGILLGITAIILMLFNVAFTNLYSFRIFIAGLVSWIILTGYALTKTKKRLN
ncbi:hypothetical protein [uncultured Aquimarina sp.]|uniref:hypothetical protein n=1 Tax=uncultured Aquimarina sp. TaxID=575652 RepID=UPI00261AB0D6|nr:hypothetical protein [uncultured Aquimarina sp.]